MEQSEIKNIINDPELLNTIDIDELLKAINDDSTDYLENKTIKSINLEIFEAIKKLNVSEERMQDLCNKLIDYRLVNKIGELHKGKLVKTIKLNIESLPTLSPEFNVSELSATPNRLQNNLYYNPIIHMKGKVVNIKKLNNCHHVVCLTVPNRYSQYNFNNFLTFQKLSTEEQVILTAYEYI